MQVGIEKIFVDLIKKELDMPDNYGFADDGNEIPSVSIKSQNIKLYNTPKMQITVSTASNQIFANNKEFFEENNKYYERININENRVIQIDVYSRDNEARQRFWEVQACLNSCYAEELMSKYHFRISKISNSFNTSGLEGGSDINRYTIRFNCLTWNTKITEIPYYDKFEDTVEDEDGIFAEHYYEAGE